MTSNSQSQAEVIRQTLINFLSAQPELTAMNRECYRVIVDTLGREPGKGVVGPIKRELGITHRTGSLSGKQGDTFVTYWTLPEERSSLITGADRGRAAAIVQAVAGGDNAAFATTWEQSQNRLEQLVMALAQIAAGRDGR
jgi:hypothetical protein